MSAAASRPPPPNPLADVRPKPTYSDQVPIEDQPDWQCDTCSHVNLPIRDHCLICKSRKPLNPRLIDPKSAHGGSLTTREQRGFDESSPRQPRNPAFRNRSQFDDTYPQDGSRDPSASRPLFADRYAQSETARRLEATNNARFGQRRREGEVPWRKSRQGEWSFRPTEDIPEESFRVRRIDVTPTPEGRLPAAPTRPETLAHSFSKPQPRRQASSFGDFVAKQQFRLGQQQGGQTPQQNIGLGGFRPRSRSSGKSGLEELLEAVTPKGESLLPRNPRRSIDENSNWQRTTSRKGSLEQAAEDIPEMLVPVANLENLDQRGNSRLDARTERRSQRFEIEDHSESQHPGYMRRHEKNRNRSRRQSTFIEQQEYTVRSDEDELLDRPEKKKKAKDKKPAHGIDGKPRIYLPEFISVENLAKVLGIRFQDFVAQLEGMGFEEVRNDHILDAETSGLIASEFNFEPIFSTPSATKDLVARPVPQDKSNLPRRPPIVTIMGHVDHGKTTILDWLRKTSVAASEHGGITQHIGAFAVTLPDTNERITFLDTPGHSAFLDMRRRGANVTDIVVLVVAADDSVKPQTLEAIKHALDAKVEIIVAINKIDKEDANIERVKQDLARHGLSVEDYGGNYQAIPVSGKTGKGMKELEEAIVLLASVQDYRAETDGQAEGWIIESKVSPAGRVATVLVRRGTMRPGDFIVAGTTWGRIRTLRDDTGQLVDEAPPGTPVQIDGWRGEDPSAGLEVLQAENEELAKSVVEYRLEVAETARLTNDTAAINAARSEEAEARAKVLEWEAQQEWAKKRAHARPKDNEGWVEESAASTAGGKKLVHFVIKGDVAGSVEALVGAVSAVGNNEIAPNIIRSGVGVVTESDVQHLAATGETGFIISFNQPPVESSIGRMAEASGLKILDHNIIYKVTDDVKERLEGLLPPLVTQRVLGEAEVGKIFEISVKKGKLKIAGCKISNGTIARDKKVRVLRRGEEIFNGKSEY